VTVPAAPVAGVPSRGSGVSAPTPMAGRLSLYLGYAVIVPAILLAAIAFGLLWLRRRRVSARRLNLEVPS
jgi:hypothetical protein